MKANLGKAGSVTHLGHAAIVMTMLNFTPVEVRPMHCAHLKSLLFINGRKYLDQDVPGSQDHISLCRAFSAIEFRNVENFILSDNASNKEIQEKLKLACTEAFRSYQAVRNQKSFLIESIYVAENMVKARYIQTVSDQKIPC